MLVDSTLHLSAEELSVKEWKRLFTALTFEDAEGREVQAYRILRDGRVQLPRGAWALLPDHVEYEDRRRYPEADWLGYEFNVELDSKGFSGQQDALRAIGEQEQGLVIAQPGFGKTQVALAFVATNSTPTIVFVHTEDIFNQWVQYAGLALDVQIGKIQAGLWQFGQLTIAMVQTVSQDLERYRTKWAQRYGAVVIDEAHHSPARTWEMILNASPARYRIGFSATQGRADGMEPLMQHLVGPVIYRHKFELKVPTRYVPLKTDFYYPYRGPYDWHRMLRALTTDPNRNYIIAKTIHRRLAKGDSVLVLSRQIKHLELINEHMGHDTEMLTGKTPKPRRLKMLNEFREGKIKCLLATQLADEALDVPILSCVILTFPGKHDGRIVQQVGRALREHEGKEEAVIIDIFDPKIGVLYRQWKERRRAIKAMKIKIKKSDEPVQVSRSRERRETTYRLRKRLQRR